MDTGAPVGNHAHAIAARSRGGRGDEAFAQITEILRCKWTMAIIDAIARGVNRPGRLERELPGLRTKVLNERVRKLERFGVIVRRAFPENPPRVEYAFTARGERLLGLVHAIHLFADDWQASSAVDGSDHHCGK